ncbi:uncharacterized protein si:ch211-170d8.2 isoform X2 [Lates calcarifer]|uniref:Uncharacterized protein si:ch211-170d8.2 isoform X2 n=1 Tax=Lates calcarifer TaxID=8187 RepID=A0AAJ7LJQ0_LATCA|nr:uncharacterized protein si:ch211-170d8.2 isoform X2 [Lates calcarifer]
MSPLSVGYIARKPKSWHHRKAACCSCVKIQRSGFRNLTMASSHCIWIALFLLSVMTSDIGVFARAVDTLGIVSQSPETEPESSGQTLRTDALRRWRRGIEGAHRERCTELAAPWLENTQPAPEDNATMLQLRVGPFSPGASWGLVFPGKSLFSFVRRVYHCCQEGLNCRSVKGIQGRLRGVTRAELHLQLSNPQHLDVHPVLPFMAKHGLPTRYGLWLRGSTVELRVDLLFLFQSLQEAAGGAGGGPSLVNMRRVVFSSPPGEKPAPRTLQDTDGDAWGDGVAKALPTLELGLILGCSQAGVGMSCEGSGVHLSHTPFMALYYR